MLADVADEGGILGHGLADDVAGAFERGLHIRHLGGDETGGELFRVAGAIREDRLGQRREPLFARRLGAVAPFGAEGEVEVFEPDAGRRRHDRGRERVGQLALLTDRFQHRLTARFKITQIGQARFERAQLGIVETARRLLPVASDEGHRRAAIDQRDRRRDLFGARTDLLGDDPFRGSGRRGHEQSLFTQGRWACLLAFRRFEDRIGEAIRARLPVR